MVEWWQEEERGGGGHRMADVEDWAGGDALDYQFFFSGYCIAEECGNWFAYKEVIPLKLALALLKEL